MSKSITKLHLSLLENCRKITLGFKFEEKHREFLQAHEEHYWISDPGRICFFDDARLDVVAYFGDDGWTAEQGGYFKEIDGIVIKLLTEWMKGPVKLSAPNPPDLKPATLLDVVGSDNGKIAFPVVHGTN